VLEFGKSLRGAPNFQRKVLLPDMIFPTVVGGGESERGQNR
jgi:hypothetical protein